MLNINMQNKLNSKTLYVNTIVFRPLKSELPPHFHSLKYIVLKVLWKLEEQ